MGYRLLYWWPRSDHACRAWHVAHCLSLLWLRKTRILANSIKITCPMPRHTILRYTQVKCQSALQRQFRLYIPFLGIARPQPQFLHSFIYLYIPRIGPHIPSSRKGRPNVGIYTVIRSRHMNVEIGTETPLFLFWEYFLPIFGIFSLQCAYRGSYVEKSAETHTIVSGWPFWQSWDTWVRIPCVDMNPALW